MDIERKGIKVDLKEKTVPTNWLPVTVVKVCCSCCGKRIPDNGRGFARCQQTLVGVPVICGICLRKSDPSEVTIGDTVYLQTAN